jgi:hypothetical protein
MTIAVESLSDANKRIFAKAGMQLPVVTIADAGVSMVANTRYQGSIAAFTADRNYTLPAGTAGDVIEVALTTGDDTYELILLGASGVSINGGSSATEWSRLFISNEFVRFRCIATNDWRVDIDGRAFESIERFGTATTTYTTAARTKFVLGGSVGETLLAGTNEVVVRRSGIYSVSGFNIFQPGGGTGRQLEIQVAAAGSGFVSAVAMNFVYGSQQYISMYVEKQRIAVAAGQAISLFYYTDGGDPGPNQYYTDAVNRPRIEVRRVG